MLRERGWVSYGGIEREGELVGGWVGGLLVVLRERGWVSGWVIGGIERGDDRGC